MAMIDDRKLTARIYNESMAAAIHGRLQEHAALPHRWLSALAAP